MEINLVTMHSNDKFVARFVVYGDLYHIVAVQTFWGQGYC